MGTRALKILITGHKGYIGSHLFKKLQKGNHEISGIDIKEGNDILHCLPDENFDCVFHLAALPRVEYSVENPFYTMKQNVLVTSRLLEWSRNHGVKTLVFSSSSALYGLFRRSRVRRGIFNSGCSLDADDKRGKTIED